MLDKPLRTYMTKELLGYICRSTELPPYLKNFLRYINWSQLAHLQQLESTNNILGCRCGDKNLVDKIAHAVATATPETPRGNLASVSTGMFLSRRRLNAQRSALSTRKESGFEPGGSRPTNSPSFHLSQSYNRLGSRLSY